MVIFISYNTRYDTDMYSKQKTVLITNILMTSHLVDFQIYNTLYNQSIDNSRLELYYKI